MTVFRTEADIRKIANVSDLGTYMDDDGDSWYFVVAAPGCYGAKTKVQAVSRDLAALNRIKGPRAAIYRGFVLPGSDWWQSTADKCRADRVA